jgi:hypothetical protein
VDNSREDQKANDLLKLQLDETTAPTITRTHSQYEEADP